MRKQPIAAILCTLLLSAFSASQIGLPFPGPGTAHSSGAQTPTFVSYKEGSNASGTTVATSATMNVATGDFVAACIGAGENSFPQADGVTISDGGSNTMTCFTDGSRSSSVGGLSMCYKSNAVANATATWTATYGGTHSYMQLMVANYTGVAASSPADNAAPACNAAGCVTATTANTRSGQNITTTNATDLLVACSYDNNSSTYTGATSHTLRAPATTVDHMLADKNVSSTGSYPAGNWATNSGSVAHQSLYQGFKAGP